MGGPYNIPRSYKGENKILFIFSMKSFLYTVAGGVIGILLYYILSLLKLGTLGLFMIVLFAFLGFAIGTFKIPEVTNFEFAKKVGGESIDNVILRYIKFKQKNNKIYDGKCRRKSRIQKSNDTISYWCSINFCSSIYSRCNL